MSADRMIDRPDYLPISMLNQLLYCERRFWLMYVHGEMAINAAVLEGTQQHERAHSGGVARDGGTIIHRRVYLWSDKLHVAGFADVVEERDGVYFPVEYKRGRMGRWINDQVQLCAQAMCLEERTGVPVERGAIFYWRSRRRVEIELDAALRRRLQETVDRAFALLNMGQLPPPLDVVGEANSRAKCHDCSLENVCLPREVMLLTRKEV